MNTYRSGLKQTSIGCCLLALAAACADGSGAAVEARGELVDRTTQALGAGALLFANGTYNGCVDRTGSWSVALDDFAGDMTNDPLSVIKDDVGCGLTLVSLTTGAADQPGTWVTEVAAPAIDMTDSYGVSASSFDDDAFYANARLSAVSFASDFSVSVIYSDDPDLAATGADTASYLTSSASAATDEVSSPDYSINMTNIVVQTDAGDVVEAASGTAQLAAGSVSGERYVVLNSSPGTSYASIDAAYLAATPALLSDLTSLQLPAAAFDIVGADLTGNAVRYIVISRTENDVRAYQVITVTFSPAT